MYIYELQNMQYDSINLLMKKSSYLLLLALCLFGLGACNNISDRLADAVSGATRFAGMDGNSMYHQGEPVRLNSGAIEVLGELKEPGRVVFRRQIKREVFIRETRIDADGRQQFAGAYRYRGYSLFDLLHPFEYQKKNVEEFRPGTDLYVVVENDLGETVVFSFSEIFHTAKPHQILIAIEMAPIEPYRAEVNYPMGDTWKLVSAGDLYAERHLENPVRIYVHSFDKQNYPINRDLDPLFSESLLVKIEENPVIEINKQYAAHIKPHTYHTVFYGMGMGYHHNPTFTGPYLHELLEQHIKLTDPELLRHGLVCFAGIDGYRAVFSFSQLFNRIDQSPPILAIPDDPSDGGYYRVFLPDAFYADYSVKALSNLYIYRK